MTCASKNVSREQQLQRAHDEDLRMLDNMLAKKTPESLHRAAVITERMSRRRLVAERYGYKLREVPSE